MFGFLYLKPANKKKTLKRIKSKEKIIMPLQGSSLVEELEIALKELEERGIKHPDALYKRIKMIKATIDSIQNHFISFKKND